MKNSNKPNSSTAENFSACFDGVGSFKDSSSFNESDRKKWETYALISDVMGKKQTESLYISNFAENMKKKILSEPIHSNNLFSSFTNWLKNKYKKIPVMLAGPALAFGLVFVLVEPTTDKINVVEENEIPKIMESYCQLHENGTGGAALC